MSHIQNFSIIAHIGHGKSTLVDHIGYKAFGKCSTLERVHFEKTRWTDSYKNQQVFYGPARNTSILEEFTAAYYRGHSIDPKY